MFFIDRDIVFGYDLLFIENNKKGICIEDIGGYDILYWKKNWLIKFLLNFINFIYICD